MLSCKYYNGPARNEKAQTLSKLCIWSAEAEAEQKKQMPPCICMETPASEIRDADQPTLAPVNACPSIRTRMYSARPHGCF